MLLNVKVSGSMQKPFIQSKNVSSNAKTHYQMRKMCYEMQKTCYRTHSFYPTHQYEKKIIQGDNMLSNTQQELSNTKTSYLMWKCVIHCKKRVIQRENVFLKILHLIFWRFLGFEIFKVQLFQFSGLNRKTGTIKVSGWSLKHNLKVAGLLLQSCRKFQKFHCNFLHFQHFKIQ